MITESRRPGDLSARLVLQRPGFRLDAAFDVAAGEVLGVIGPNGGGKTTLLRAVAGLDQLTDGSIRLGSEIYDEPASVVFVPPEKRPIGFVYQDYRLFPHLSVLDNVAFGPRCRGNSRTAARRVAEDWLQRLDLAEFSSRAPAQLSGGQAQRVALARALAGDPAILLLDEPLAALDARTKLQVRSELRRHLTAFAGPTLLVTHDPLEAMVLADRLLVLEAGQVVQQGSPGEVARRPATQYVARLVGLNLYSGTATSSGEIRLDGEGVLVAAAGDTSAFQRVLVAVAPTAISLHTVQPRNSSFRNIWAGTVAGLELLTDRVRVQIDGSPPALVDITARAVADLRLAEGARVWLAAKATEVDVYPDPAIRPGG